MLAKRAEHGEARKETGVIFLLGVLYSGTIKDTIMEHLIANPPHLWGTLLSGSQLNLPCLLNNLP